MNRSFSIFFYEGYVGVSPTIVNLSKVLDNHGSVVNIYGNENNYAQPGKLGIKTKVFYFKKYNRIFNFFKDRGLKDALPLFELILYISQCLIQRIRTNRNPFKKYINIGVDIYGAITSLIFFYLFKDKFLFLSLELHKPDKFKGISKILEILVKAAYRKSEALLIQDEDRYQTFAEYYQYQHPQIFYLPNSTLPLDQSYSELNQENLFRKKFNLSPEEFSYIILQAGMICDAVCSKSLAQVFTSIDGGYALVFHDRSPRKEDPYIQSLRQINSKNLFLSLEPLPYEEIDRVYTAATIGLAFYADLGNNFTQISMASGKLAQYLKHGKPVLVNNLPSLSRLIERYKIGIVIQNPDDPEEIKLALEKILNHYSTYSHNAKICFDAEFDFSKKMKPILDFISEVKPEIKKVG